MHALKYSCLFDSLGLAPYKLEIWQKGYSGEIFNIIGGATPVLHQWETDDPKAAIKGSSLSITLINDGSLPLSSFYSTDDDAFLVLFYHSGNLLFKGYLVQDDCSETLVDYTHEILLSANDNLGLLKEVPLNKANIYSRYYTLNAPVWIGGDYNTRTFLVGPEIQNYISEGDRIVISDTGIIDGTYTSYKISRAPTGTLIYVEEPLPANYTGNGIWSVYKPANLFNRTPLSTILRMCLSVTNLELNTNVYSKIIEVSQDPTKSFIEQTLIDPQTFLKSDTEYTDCYDVLTKILERFNMTLFQANGVWNIVRWDELRYFDNLIEGFSYDKNFTPLGPVTLGAPFIAGMNEAIQAENGILQKICRPFLYDKETFNYQYPKQLLRNFNLQQLGGLIRTYTKATDTDTLTIEEYSFPWWTGSALPQSTTGEYFIRVTLDSLGNELERVLALKGDILSYPIEVNKGDYFQFSFSFKTEDSQPGNLNLICIVELNDGTTRQFFHNPALTNGNNMWQTGLGFTYNVPSGDNTNNWHSVEIDCSRFPIPYDGLLYCYLRVADLSGTINETYYKDIRFEYTALINESTKIIGQTHTQTQAGTIKNNEDVEIFVDSSPRNSISGTLFLNEKVGLLQKRTELWKHPSLPEPQKLGNLITYDQLFWRLKPRTILEGSLYGLIVSGQHVSLISIFRYTHFEGVNLAFGRMEIDYRNNKVTGTLWELWQDDETVSNSKYKFEYLYSVK